MQKILFASLALAVLLVCGAPGIAAAASAMGAASARIVGYVLSIEKIRDLKFGMFAGDGMITVHRNDDPAVVMGSIQLITPPERGRVKVTGDAGDTITAAIAPEWLTLTGTEGTPPHPTLHAHINIDETAVLDGEPGEQGEARLFIGGKLTIPPGTPPDQYWGAFMVTVDY